MDTPCGKVHLHCPCRPVACRRRDHEVGFALVFVVARRGKAADAKPNSPRPDKTGPLWHFGAISPGGFSADSPQGVSCWPACCLGSGFCSASSLFCSFRNSGCWTASQWNPALACRSSLRASSLSSSRRQPSYGCLLSSHCKPPEITPVNAAEMKRTSLILAETRSAAARGIPP